MANAERARQLLAAEKEVDELYKSNTHWAGNNLSLARTEKREIADKVASHVSKHARLQDDLAKVISKQERQDSEMKEFIDSLVDLDGNVNIEELRKKLREVKQSQFDHALVLVTKNKGSLDFLSRISPGHRAVIAALHDDEVKTRLTEVIASRDKTIEKLQEDLETMVQLAGSKDQELVAMKTSLEQQIQDKAKDASSLLEAVSRQKGEIKKLEGDVMMMSHQISTANDEYSSKASEVSKLNEELSDKAKSISDLTRKGSDKDLHISQLEESLRRSTTRLSTLENDLRDKDRRIAELGSKFTVLEGDIAARDRLVVDTGEKAKALEQACSSKDDRISSMESDLRGKDRSIIERDGKIERFEQDVSALKTKQDEMKALISELDSEARWQKAEIMTLEVKLSTKSQVVSEKDEEIARLDEQLQALAGEAAKLANQLKAADQKLSDACSDVDSLDRELKAARQVQTALASEQLGLARFYAAQSGLGNAGRFEPDAWVPWVKKLATTNWIQGLAIPRENEPWMILEPWTSEEVLDPRPPAGCLEVVSRLYGQLLEGQSLEGSSRLLRSLLEHLVGEETIPIDAVILLIQGYTNAMTGTDLTTCSDRLHWFFLGVWQTARLVNKRWPSAGVEVVVSTLASNPSRLRPVYKLLCTDAADLQVSLTEQNATPRGSHRFFKEGFGFLVIETLSEWFLVIDNRHRSLRLVHRSLSEFEDTETYVLRAPDRSKDLRISLGDSLDDVDFVFRLF
ncbi:uncharacterized protein JN550_008603 [Neoarthrinium moseri]|uniref:uncharacterized protein n=1 Tax=Neoarthrinium moseri TaxID=1658444 RepID=UPI001FDCA5A3|nr:uncharacterized protein JN550_008603 [Neoarthrinium moseri]KAI1865057.1 hypothetical protein JN550_008603 [Neoarthrinium moseri]